MELADRLALVALHLRRRTCAHKLERRLALHARRGDLLTAGRRSHLHRCDQLQDHRISHRNERDVEDGNEIAAADIESALAAVGAPAVLDNQLSQLSGGEGQRVLMARALLRRPDLLVLDEPVRGVDYAGEAELYGLIGRLRDERGFGVLLVSHDLHVVMAASDRVLCLNRHVCCSGVPTTVARHPEYVRLFGADTARAFAVYEHHHDHAHDLAGRPLHEGDAAAKGPGEGSG